MVRTITLLLAMLAIAAAPAAPPTVRIAYPSLGPIISTKGGTAAGIVADVLRAAAQREGVTLEFVPLSGDAASVLSSGGADAVAPTFITATGSAAFDYSTTIATTGGALFVRAPNPEPPGLAALAGKAVATPSFGPYVGFIRQNFPSVTLVTTSGYPETLDDVLAGRADAAALNIQEGAAVVAESYAQKITVPKTMFLTTQLVLAVAKGTHADFLRQLDAGLAAIRADGTMQRLTSGPR